MRAFSRTLTTFAAGFLALDAVLLSYAGIELHRWGFIVGGAACGAGVLGVVLAWRRHRRKVVELAAEIAEARRAMRAEVESIRELLREHHLQN